MNASTRLPARDQGVRAAQAGTMAGEDDYRELFELAADSMMLLDQDRVIREVNQVACERLGYSKDELLGRRIDDFVPAEHGALLNSRYGDVDHRGYLICESAIVRKDGSVLPVEVCNRAVRWRGEKGFFGILRDISARKQADELAQQLSGLLNDSFNEIFTFDAGDLHFVHVSKGAQENLGYSLDELKRLTPVDIKPLFTADTFGRLLDPLRNGKQRLLSFETVHRRKDGTTYPVEVRLQLMGRPPSLFLAIIRDLTERKASDAKIVQLSRLYAALSHSNEAIVRCSGRAELFPRICRDAVEFGGFRTAWIGMVDSAGRTLGPASAFGAGSGYLKGLTLPLDAEGSGLVARSVRDNRLYWSGDFQRDLAAFDRENTARSGWAAFASIPLTQRGAVVGALIVFSGEAGAFDDEVVELLIEMGADISYALDRYASEEERTHAEEALRTSEQQLRTIIDTEPECVKLVGPDGGLIDMNAAGLAMLEAASVEEARRHSLLDFILPEHRESFLALHRRVMDGHTASLEFEIRGLRGTQRWLETHAAPMRDGKGRITALLGVTRDITERKRSEDRIQYLANFDVLTGLPNRAQLDNRLKYALSLAKRNGRRLAVMFIDIDRFKDINDTLGHTIGDAFLVEAARRLQASLREEDTVSRLGGDEFIVMLPDSDPQSAAQVAEKLLAALAEPCRVEQYDLNTTASIGIALYPDDGHDLETLASSADTAMYKVKQEGRNGYRFFTAEMQARAIRNMQLIHALRHAQELGQLQVHYQPQVSLRDGHVVGVEALLRWRHPELGDVPPATFVPLAEDSGLIVPIGEWVLRTAVRQLKSWIDGGLPPMVMAVNLSAIQFRQARLADLVGRILEEARLPPECLEFELTEGAAMHEPGKANAVLANLHRLGVRISIDDFGTGYSSLNQLKQFNVSKLKIDQTFVRDIGVNMEDRVIVSAIISMATSLGLKTIAEGVETAEQLAFLRGKGCDEAQGYYFSKPLPAAEVAKFLAAAGPGSQKSG